MLACVGVAAIAAATADAAQYKMLLCAANNGSNSYVTATNTNGPQNPGGIFSFENHCGPAPDPAGDRAFLRIAENQGSGTAGHGAYGSIYYDSPSHIHFKAAGGYTRQPNAFNQGWRARFWAIDYNNNGVEFLNQGVGAPTGITNTFSPHLWSPPGIAFWRFVMEMQCVRPSGCDRSNFNAYDANSFVFVLHDEQDARTNVTVGSPLMGAQWVRGTHSVTWNPSDNGSGLRFERIRVDGSLRHQIDHHGSCDLDYSFTNGEFARRFSPCPTGEFHGRSWPLDTSTVPDGQRNLHVCAQDYAQAVGLNGTGSESCELRYIYVDNTPPGAPAALQVVTSNPQRYQDRFGATFSLPPNQGSPIARVHYEIVDAAGKVVVPEKVVSKTNPTDLAGVEGPKAPGAYRLRVWLGDTVGFSGPASTVAIPHDSTPPAAPQELRVVAPTDTRRSERFGLRWRNVLDDGSPIDTAHYQVLDAAGEVVVATRTARGKGIEAIHDLQAPPQRASYVVRLWLSDEEGNVGAAARVAVPHDSMPPAAPQDVSVTPPSRSRASEGFDLRWRNVADDGSPIVAAHYRVLGPSGEVVVPTRTVSGRNVEAIADLDAPGARAGHTLRLWLSDEEGNVGAPVSVALEYSCVRSEVGGGTSLTSAIESGGRERAVVAQGRGATLRGRLLAGRGGAGGASLCVFGRVVTKAAPEFLGISLTNPDGRYRFAVPAGPSRELTVAYRGGHRELTSGAQLYIRVKPFFAVRRKVVRNKGVARFMGRIPGPNNDDVVVVLQVKRGEGWLAFRRYKTRDGGRFTVGYRFTRTDRPTLYMMRAQVRSQGGYPYLQGTSDSLRLVVLPARGERP